MLRLRTTVTLSTLALVVGVAGTGWLSEQTAGWAGPSEQVAGFTPARHATPAPRVAWHASVRHADHQRVLRNPVVVQPVRLPPVVATARADEAPPPPELVPVAMPQAPVAWSRMKDHLHGQVLLRVSVDGRGQVRDVALAASSGDPVLDAHALATVQGWRFAVPAGYPEGFSANLPMRYTDADGRAAQAP